MSLIMGFILLSLFLLAQGLTWFGLRTAFRGLPSISALQKGAQLSPRLTLDARLSEVQWLDRALTRWAFAQSMDRWLEQSGVSVRLDRALLFLLLAAIAGAASGWIFPGGVLGSLLGSFLGIFSPLVIVDWRRRRRQATLTEQLPDALDGLARSLQAGNALSVSIGLIAKDSPQPIASALRLAADEIRFGASLRWGLNGLVRRIDNMDVRFFAVAVAIQGQTGGNLSALLFKLSNIIRERHKAARAAQILSADGRLSAWILALMPFATGAAIYLLNPEFISVLWTDPRGLRMIQAAMIMMAVGILWMVWIVRDQD